MEPNHTWLLTFGQKSPLRHGWVEVEAPSYESAVEAVKYAFGDHWSNLYEVPFFDRGMFPAGKFGETLIGGSVISKTMNEDTQKDISVDETAEAAAPAEEAAPADAPAEVAAPAEETTEAPAEAPADAPAEVAAPAEGGEAAAA